MDTDFFALGVIPYIPYVKKAIGDTASSGHNIPVISPTHSVTNWLISSVTYGDWRAPLPPCYLGP